MPPKKLPHEYEDANRLPDLEDLALADALKQMFRKHWEFLPETQLDENALEWRDAAMRANFDTDELQVAEMQARELTLIHACGKEALEDLAITGLLTSHKYRIEHPKLYPRYRPRHTYPTVSESTLGLDDYVNFSFEGFSFFADRPGMSVVSVNAIDLLTKRSGIVFPFDSMATLVNTPFHERPMLLQALALRTTDYASLLPQLIAAENRNEPSSVLPEWFSRRFGEISYKVAEVKISETAYIPDILVNISGDTMPNLQ